MSGTLINTARRINAQTKTRGLPALFFVTDTARTPDPARIAETLPRGTGIILRHYDAKERVAIAWTLARIARKRGLVLLIAADPALARLVRADGVHWPEGLMARARHRFGITTVAAHDAKALIRLRRIGADAALLSPVFATRSGAQKRPLGVLRFAALARLSPAPVYALGGVSALTVKRLLHSGAAGLAAVDAFL